MLDFKNIEKETLKYWKDKNIYQKVKEKNKDGKKYYFLQGPPFTSGKIHIGHAWNNSLKDIILRYKRMKGLNIWDRGGYDMHGLPTSQKVQKKLGLKDKGDIEKYGVDKFVKECKDFSIEHAKIMNKDLWGMGIWIDNENAYYPVTNEYISGEWRFFKKAWEDGRLYKGKKVMHWDAETETSLAKHELEYETVTDESVFLKFKKKGTENEYFIVWTTTPWTIVFNLAIMVNPEIDYVKVKVDDEYWIVADALAGIFVSGLLEKKVEVVEKFKGVELEGQEYVHPLNDEIGDVYTKLKIESPKMHSIILSEDFVDTTAGTGLVHCAPGCGPEDFEVGKKYGILPYNSLNEKGIFEDVGKYSGWAAKKDDNKFIQEFEDKGVLIAKTMVEHEYPHSDRSKEPVIFRTTEQWFLKTEDLIKRLIEFNKSVNWVPKKSGESYERWAENLRDNGITRQRYWGCPVPIWVNEDDETDYFVVGSIEELEELSGKKVEDAHKPWIDKIIVEKNGKKYKRIPDVADVWIDSGTASWNCLYNDDKLIEEWFPADLVLEATEQTRLWFSLLQICSAVMFDKSCYDNVFVHGMMLDYQGTKMSKSIGNVISPYEVINKYSADILRYFICQVNAGDNINFSWEDIKVKQRNLIMLGNVANYILDLEKQEVKSESGLGIEEKWILSKYNSTLKKVSELFEDYKLDETIGMIEDLFVTLSRDYIKYVRDKASKDKIVGKTLREVYTGILKMFCTICPFVSEHLWDKIGNREELESVHLCSWPDYDADKIDVDLERKFEALMKVIESGLRLRDKEQIGLKWPLAEAKIKADVVFDENIIEILKGQLNVKSVDIEKSESKNIEVEFDFNLTDELKAEGFAREISRRVQAERKKRELQKSDVIKLKIGVNNDLRGMLEKYLEFIGDRTGAEKVEFVDGETEGMISFKIKDKEVSINF